MSQNRPADAHSQMAQRIDPTRVDVPRFAQQAQCLSGSVSLSKLERLSQEIKGQNDQNANNLQVQWQLTGRTEDVLGVAGAKSSWIDLTANAKLSMQCQRCLQALELPLSIQRNYRFVATESQAEALDAETDEFDVLVSSKAFDFVELLEDELLMALPVGAMHGSCPNPAAPSKLETLAKPNPFAALAMLKKDA